MQTIAVITGFGFIRDAQGHIISKAELPPGDHPLKDGFTYTEVADAAALGQINIYQDPAEIAQAENEKKIQTKIRSTAIEALKATGDLPADYTDSKG